MRQRFVQYVKKNQLFFPKAHLVIGVSGGADSICLLRLLCDIREEWNLTLTAVHVNHGIRGVEAKADAEYVSQMAKEWGVPVVLVERDVPRVAKETGQTEEEAGRCIRYEAFRKIAEEQKAHAIAVAHHMDDQAETVLFHMIRGTGISGLAGMLPKRDDIIRPLLGFTRKEIETYLAERHIAFCRDSSNEDTTYARNCIRKHLIPEMQKLNPQVIRHLSHMSRDICRWSFYMEGQIVPIVKKAIHTQGKNVFLDIHFLLEQEEVIQEEVLRQFIQQGLGSTKDVARWHYEQTKALLHKETGKGICLPGGRVVYRQYDFLLVGEKAGTEEESFWKECKIPSVNIVTIDGENTCIKLELVKRGKLPEEIPEKDYTKWFDYDKIKNGLILRNPQEGDYFVLDSKGHRKKLSRYFIDEKVPLEERAKKMVLADGNRVMWVVSGRMDAGYKITSETENVLVVTKERVQNESGN